MHLKTIADSAFHDLACCVRWHTSCRTTYTIDEVGQAPKAGDLCPEILYILLQDIVSATWVTFTTIVPK